MSQFFQTSSDSNIPSDVPNKFTAEDATFATPVAHNINLVGGNLGTFLIANYDNNGIATTASGSTLKTYLSNRDSVLITTSNNTKTAAITFALDANPGVYYFWGNVQAFNTTAPAGAAYSFSGAFRTNGVTNVEIGTDFADIFEEASMTALNLFVEASSNNVVISVQGLAANTIDWNILMDYRRVL